MYEVEQIIDSSYFPYVFALLALFPFMVLLRQFVHQFLHLKNQELKMLSIKGNAENKNQAYERMVLFLERIKPANLVNKFDKNLLIQEYLFLVEKTINEEYEYNSSQQLYISQTSWQGIVNAKNAIIKLLHNTYEDLNSNTNLEEFKTIFLMKYMQGDDYISQNIDLLRREIILIT